MKLGDLDAASLRQRLARRGILLRTPPFTSRIRSDSPLVVEGLLRCYAAFELAPDDDFADFDLQVSLERHLLHRRSARFWSDGRPAFTALPANQAFHMIEWGLNWAITAHAHQFLVFHAAVLERQGRAVVLPAPPGSGKSTLTAALCQRGWRLLSDELALCDTRTGELVGLARPVNLKNDSIALMKAFAPDARFTSVVPGTAKGTLALMAAPADSVARVTQRAHPAWLVLPRYRAGSPAHLAPLDKAVAFIMLAEQSFNYDIHGVAGFEATAALIDRCDCHEFVYSSLDEAIAVFDHLSQTGAPR